jgi:ubiquinone/menaquinone biosynthesis C-methylase UbiE
VCGGEDSVELFSSHDWIYGRPGSFPLVRCTACGLVYLRERPTRSALPFYYPDESYYAYRAPAAHSLFQRRGALAATWYAVKRSLLAHACGYRHLGGHRLLAALTRLPLLGGVRDRATFQLDVLLHPFVAEGALLEVGCGAGMYLDLMRALGWKKVVGVDFSPTAVAQARGPLGLEAHCGELTDVGLAENSFDAVSMSHTLEHVADPVGLLSEARRVMKVGGRLAVIVPNVESLSSRIFKEHCLMVETPRHLTHFTKSSLALALNRAGFMIERLTTSPRGAYQVALFSHSRQAGDDRLVYTDSNRRFPLARRLRAAGLAALEHGLCSLGRPAGEELTAVARKAR